MDSIEAKIEKIETEITDDLLPHQLCRLLYGCLPPDTRSDKSQMDSWSWKLADVAAANLALGRARRFWRSDPVLAERWLQVAMMIYESADTANFFFGEGKF
ncbi:MAG: hypothetical protein ACYDHY_14970 [Acidiferrobacterales bacterium]